MSEKKDQRKVKATDKEDKKTEDNPVDNEKAEKLKGDMDKLLDEIDDILEEEGQDFIKSYVQRGGE